MTNNSAQKLTARQLRAIAMVIQAKSVSEGVQRAKVSRRQFYEWMKDPVFVAEYARLRESVAAAAFHHLRISIEDAVRVLTGLMSSENESVRFRAAESIIERYMKLRELDEIEERLAVLEQIVAEDKADRAQ